MNFQIIFLVQSFPSEYHFYVDIDLAYCLEGFVLKTVCQLVGLTLRIITESSRNFKFHH